MLGQEHATAPAREAVREACGAWMKIAKEQCGRPAGHAGKHCTAATWARRHEYMARYDASEKGRAKARRYAASEKGRAKARRSDASEKGKERRKRHATSDTGRASQKRWRENPEVKARAKERSRRYHQTEQGKATRAAYHKTEKYQAWLAEYKLHYVATGKAAAAGRRYERRKADERDARIEAELGLQTRKEWISWLE